MDLVDSMLFVAYVLSESAKSDSPNVVTGGNRIVLKRLGESLLPARNH
jgi:hypothetical protein